MTDEPIQYPFRDEVISERKLTDWLTMVIYPKEYQSAGSERTGAKKRVRARIRYARITRALPEPFGNKVLATRFFEWAMRQKGWGALKRIKQIPLDTHITPHGIQAQAISGKVQSLNVPNEYKELKVEYKEQAKALENARSAIKSLEDENDKLRLELQTKRERQLRASKFGKQGAGITRTKKEFD